VYEKGALKESENRRTEESTGATVPVFPNGREGRRMKESATVILVCEEKNE